jgi:hypothetical protein
MAAEQARAVAAGGQPAKEVHLDRLERQGFDQILDLGLDLGLVFSLAHRPNLAAFVRCKKTSRRADAREIG